MGILVKLCLAYAGEEVAGHRRAPGRQVGPRIDIIF
jgi:hypothetical protein